MTQNLLPVPAATAVTQLTTAAARTLIAFGCGPSRRASAPRCARRRDEEALRKLGKHLGR